MRWLLLALTLLAANATGSLAIAEPREALVIANAAYANGSLQRTHEDGDLIAAALEANDFHVVVLRDATRLQMLGALREYSARLSRDGKDSTGFVYYAGH